MRKPLKYGLPGVAVMCAVAAVVLIPAKPVEPPSSFLAGAQADPTIRGILFRSCGDCHSDSTRYPFYSFLPIASARIADDIARGREQLNLSRWREYSRLRQQRALTGIANQVRDGAMPLREYLLLHPSARLSEEEIQAVFEWAQRERLRLIVDGVSQN